jgi:hypothetical protein
MKVEERRLAGPARHLREARAVPLLLLMGRLYTRRRGLAAAAQAAAPDPGWSSRRQPSGQERSNPKPPPPHRPLATCLRTLFRLVWPGAQTLRRARAA